MKRFLWLVVLCLVVATADAQIGAEVFEPEMYVSPTEYDYTNVALFLTKNSKTKREKARAIYDWICENIAYDTSYSIYTADECYDNKKGVCQAYSELFYRLCEPIGVECYVVSGISKDYDKFWFGFFGAAGFDGAVSDDISALWKRNDWLLAGGRVLKRACSFRKRYLFTETT